MGAIELRNLKASATPPKYCAPSQTAAQRDLITRHGLLLLHLRTAHFPVLVEGLREHHCALPDLWLQPGHQVQTGRTTADGRGRRKHTNAEPGRTARMGSTGAAASIQVGSWATRTAHVG